MKNSALFIRMVTVVLGFGLLALGPGAEAAKKLPEESPEGLKLLPKTKVSAVYLRDGADFSGYDKVAILDCYVAFKKNWKRDQNQNSARPFGVTDSDITKIKTELAEEFKKVFSKELTAKGQTVVTGDGPGVLILRPAIIDLDITAPDDMDPGVTTFSAQAGQATLFLELYDSVSSELLARILDVEAGGSPGDYINVRNRVTNKQDADRVLKKWADLLGTHLQAARAGAAAK
jgi:Protein of unknown function (DUF3313)